MFIKFNLQNPVFQPLVNYEKGNVVDYFAFPLFGNKIGDLILYL